MQGVVVTVDPTPKLTKTGRTYYRVQLQDDSWISVFQTYPVGTHLTFDPGNIPGWPRNVQVQTSGQGETKDPGPPSTKKVFGPTEFETLLHTVVEIAKRQGITDHQAIVALNNTLIIALQKKGGIIDVEGFLF